MLADLLLADDARLFLMLAVVLDALQVVRIRDALDDLERRGIRCRLDFLGTRDDAPALHAPRRLDDDMLSLGNRELPGAEMIDLARCPEADSDDCLQYVPPKYIKACAARYRAHGSRSLPSEGAD